MNQNCEIYIQDYIKQAPSNKPLFPENVTKEIAKLFPFPEIDLTQMVTRNLEEYAEKIDLENLDIEVYYSPKQTVFGKTKPPIEEIITHLSINQKDDIIGYLGGASLFHLVGLCSLMPNRKTIVTNRYDLPLCGTLITLIQPQTKITKEIARYLQILHIVNTYQKAYVDCANPQKIIKSMIEREKLVTETLLTLASKHYSKNVVSDIQEILGENTYDIAQ